MLGSISIVTNKRRRLSEEVNQSGHKPRQANTIDSSQKQLHCWGCSRFFILPTIFYDSKAIQNMSLLGRTVRRFPTRQPASLSLTWTRTSPLSTVSRSLVHSSSSPLSSSIHHHPPASASASASASLSPFSSSYTHGYDHGQRPLAGLRSYSTGASTSDSQPTPEKSSVEPELTDAEAEKIRILVEDKIAPATGRPLSEIAADVWQHNKSPTGPGHRSGLKILAKPLKGPLYKSWYLPMPHELKENPYKLTEKQERWKKKLKILRAAGKGPPKKGSGKRSK